MADTLTLTPEQLFFLGVLMDAKYIDYAYIASLQELGRNYSRSRRKCLSELAEAGVLRERLSGEISLRPGPKKLLEALFFGSKETSLEIFDLSEQPGKTTLRFHWSAQSVTKVQQENGQLTLCETTPEQMQALVETLITGTEHPVPIADIQKDAVKRIITAKQAVVEVGSKGMVLFALPGGWYTVDDSGSPVGIPASAAREAVLAELKGESV